MFDIGQRLIEIKEGLGHGNWFPWLEAEFGWSDTTARRFIRTAERFGNQANSPDLDFAKETLFLLSQDNTPEPVRQEAIERSESREKVKHRLAPICSRISY
ncbi:MAG: DUF3102 domain-containing protein [Desulfobacterium sp.]|nr:DUF3102 domain-containing protein [Desulfobacterium sp.]